MRQTFVVLAFIAAAAASLPAAAQTLLPRSRAEQHAQDTNRAIARQQQLTQDRQQTQFEINQLRNEIFRSQQFPTMIGPGTGRCGPGC
jgi:hypothetical protein